MTDNVYPDESIKSCEMIRYAFIGMVVQIIGALFLLTLIFSTIEIHGHQELLEKKFDQAIMENNQMMTMNVKLIKENHARIMYNSQLLEKMHQENVSRPASPDR